MGTIQGWWGDSGNLLGLLIGQRHVSKRGVWCWDGLEISGRVGWMALAIRMSGGWRGGTWMVAATLRVGGRRAMTRGGMARRL